MGPIGDQGPDRRAAAASTQWRLCTDAVHVTSIYRRGAVPMKS